LIGDLDAGGIDEVKLVTGLLPASKAASLCVFSAYHR
jgi:hypothetical protein